MSSIYLNEVDSFLQEKIDGTLSKLQSNASASTIENPSLMLKKLLFAAKKNEWETALISSKWALDEKDFKFACSLMRLASDEAKHLLLIEELTAEDFSFDGNYSPLFNHLDQINDTFSRIVTGPFARELLATKRNELFLTFCKKYNFSEVLQTYENIQADELHHHEMGKKYLNNLLQNEEDVLRAKKLIDDIIQVVDDIQEMVMLNKGLHYLPGC
ncbi:MAG: hypothetical protein H6622_07880 [Halobacteriovoraceae bacterium]|nr:hypothetical protein [Halobacteriovoraceae bacterium]